MNIYSINPLSDSRWDDFIARHPMASVFHERGWLEALNRTYGFEPFALTSTDGGKPLANSLVLCRVLSCITGNRLVSLPFSDHCEPLLDDPSELSHFVTWLRSESDREGSKYFELRLLPGHEISHPLLATSQSYCIHTLSLTQPLATIFGGLHRDSIQRRIRRAEREGLSIDVGRSEEVVNDFYRLLIMTRRRHHLPPQPRAWFRNLVDCMGQKLQIRVARKNRIPVAAVLSLRHDSTVVYKYGCSDEKFHHIGGMPFLFWKLIEASKESGVSEIDFGRTELENQSLITFKDRLGTTRRLMTYVRYPKSEKRTAAPRWVSRSLGSLFSILPKCVMPAVGGLMYKHVG
jgi:CelD/BcsL family acetyltransferase involved in cellulose biosynthesis